MSLQQEQVLMELYSYTHQDPLPVDIAMTIETHQYLETCNRIFEKGFLCHEKICSLDLTVLQMATATFQRLRFSLKVFSRLI